MRKKEFYLMIFLILGIVFMYGCGDSTKSSEQTMTASNLISLISAFIIAVGWFVTGYLNRRKDVAQKRLEYRLESLKSFLPVWFFIQKNSAPFEGKGFLAMLENARSNFLLYGYEDEIELMESFISSCETRNLDDANSNLSKLVPLVKNRIRKELEI